MPNKNENKPVEREEELQNDQPSANDPDPREAITHPDVNPPGNPDTSYRAGDPPPTQSLFPPDRFVEKKEEEKRD